MVAQRIQCVEGTEVESITEERVSRAAGPIFTDVPSRALGQTTSYTQQLMHGADYWRTVLDGAIGIDVYGNNGVAVGDFDNDGFDDLYVCQPAGLPNRLYRNRGDGTFEDVTEKVGCRRTGFTACALFADFQNRGLQDLLVVAATGPLLFSNNGDRTFSLKRDAFALRTRPRVHSRTPQLPTTIATASWTFIFASTATIRAWTSIAILFLISTRETALQIISSTMKATESSRTGAKLRA